MTKRFFVLLAALFFLAGCGGSGGGDGTPASNPDPSPGPSPTPTMLNGFVADGYLQNARICFDLNLNGMCDPDEPSVFSEQGGAYSIEVPQGHELSDLVILAEATTETIDEDTMEPVEYPYTLVAPYDLAEFISPISTLIYHTVASENLSLQAAQDQLAGIFGVSAEELVRDYIIYEDATLHHSAQVIASSLGALRENAIQALAENGYDENAIFNLYDPIQNLALDQVMRSLTAILVEAAKDSFNLQDALSIALDGKLQTPETILDALDGASGSDPDPGPGPVLPHAIVTALETGLFSIFSGDNNTPMLASRFLVEDALGFYLEESLHIWNSASSDWEQTDLENEGYYYFRDGQWLWEDEEKAFPAVEITDSDTMVFLDFPEVVAELHLVSTDLSGNPTSTIIPEQVLKNPGLVFPAGAAQYHMTLVTPQDTYTDFFKRTDLTSLDEIISTHRYPGGNFLSVGSIYYVRFDSFDSNSSVEITYNLGGGYTFVGTGRTAQVSHIEIGEASAIVIHLPPDIFPLNDPGRDVVFAETDLGILQGELRKAGTELDIKALNAVAKDALTGNIQWP